MDQSLRELIAAIWRPTCGFALFLSCLFLALFSCNIVTASPFNGSLEHIWIAAAVGETIGAFLAYLLRKRIPGTGSTALFFAGVVLFCLGVFICWNGYVHHEIFFPCAYFGGFLLGAGLSFCGICWGQRLSSLTSKHTEAIVAGAFLLCFIVYFAIMFFKSSSVGNLVLVILLAVGSAGLFVSTTIDGSLSIDNGMDDAPAEKRTAQRGKWGSVHRLGDGYKLDTRHSYSIILGMLWVLIAYFRVISTPLVLGNRFLHYLIPFSTSIVVALIVFFCLRRFAHAFNISLAFRVGLPVYFLSCAILFWAPDGRWVRIIAYTVNFLGMFIIQLVYWTNVIKLSSRGRFSSLEAFPSCVMSEGCGVFIGCMIAFALKESDYTILACVAFMLGAIVLLCVMYLGYSPRMLFDYSPHGVVSGPAVQDSVEVAERQAGEEAVRSDEDALVAAAKTKASGLAARFGLTAREEEIAALLLEGRTRPYISDELVVSLHTVHAHVRNIYNKCEVHSVQELIDISQSK